VRCRKLELEHFIRQHGVIVSFLSETFLNPGQVFRLDKYVCHCTDRTTAGCGSAILVQRGITHHPIPVPVLTQLEATGIQFVLAGSPAKFFAVYLSPSRSLISAVLDACLDGELPVLMAGDHNAKQIDFNSRLTTTRRKLLRDNADGNSFLIFGPNSPTRNPYDHSATPYVIDFVITRGLPSSVALVSCSALSTDLLPVLIDTGCFLAFHYTPDRPTVRYTDWAKFQTHLKSEIPLIPELHNGKDIDSFVENRSGAILGALTASTPKRRPHEYTSPLIPAGFQDEIRLKNCRR
jgi:hypothetical protein